MANTPEDNRYAKSHEYVHIEGDIGTIGITEYAQKELGDVVFVDGSHAYSYVKSDSEKALELVRLDRLEQVMSVADVDAALPVRRHAEAAHRDRVRRLLIAEPCHQLPAVAGPD